MNARVKELPSFRPMATQDLTAVAMVEADAYPFPWTLGNFRDSLNAGYSCWVFEQGDDLIGYGVVMVAVGEAHLLNLVISPRWQRRGMGRRLLQHMIRVSREHHAKYMFLEVRPSNIAGQRLYRDVGFREIGLRRNYYPATHGREDAIIMGLDL